MYQMTGTTGMQGGKERWSRLPRWCAVALSPSQWVTELNWLARSNRWWKQLGSSWTDQSCPLACLLRVALVRPVGLAGLDFHLAVARERDWPGHCCHSRNFADSKSSRDGIVHLGFALVSCFARTTVGLGYSVPSVLLQEHLAVQPLSAGHCPPAGHCPIAGHHLSADHCPPAGL